MDYPDQAKITIVGAGAIGGLLGVHLSRQGHEVTFLARGPHLAAMREAGALKLRTPEGSIVQSGGNAHFVGSLAEISEPQDLVVLGLKTHQIVSVLPLLHHAVGPRTIFLTTQNGIPWWYFQCYNGPEHLRNRTVESVDPNGVLKDGIDAGRIIASVVYPAATVGAPGMIVHEDGIRFPVGEPSGEKSERVKWVSRTLIGAGFKSPVLDDVRGELWLKAWGTTAVNPLSALTHAPLDALCSRDGPGRAVVEGVMREVEMVAMRLGSKMRLPLERRVDGAQKVGNHKTSMLQDVESGRGMETETIVGAVVELGRLAEVETPRLDTVYGTLRMLEDMVKRSTKRAKVVIVEE